MSAAGDDKRTPLMEERSASGLPIRAIPGGYGVPFFSGVIDRYNFFYVQGRQAYLRNLIARHGSTVLRCNFIPGPFMATPPAGVVALLDAASFRVVMDSSTVEKHDVALANFVLPKALHGGYRTLPFLDTSETRHAQFKSLVFRMLAARKDHFIPTFRSVYFSAVFGAVEAAVSSTGQAYLSKFTDLPLFDFFCSAFYGGEPPSVAMGPDAAEALKKWTFFHGHPALCRITGLPPPLEDLLLHYFHLPPFLVRKEQKRLEDYLARAAAAVIDDAGRLYGIPRDEALHNIVVITIINGFGGTRFSIEIVLRWLALGGPELHRKLATEVRAAVAEAGGRLTVAALEKMDLVKSVVWESLRMNPPVDSMYGRARADTVVESHDAAFRVSKGQLLMGSMSFATRDERVFKDGHKFVADRFVAAEDPERLLKYLVWSNGPETQGPTESNKQCGGKDTAMLILRLLVAELFLRYDTFAADVEEVKWETKEIKVVFRSFTKAP